MAKRLPLERADRFPGGRAAGEQQRGIRQGMVAENGKHRALRARCQVNEAVRGDQPAEPALQAQRPHVGHFGCLAGSLGNASGQFRGYLGQENGLVVGDGDLKCVRATSASKVTQCRGVEDKAGARSYRGAAGRPARGSPAVVGLDAIGVSAAGELIAIARQPCRPRVVLHHPLPALLRLIRPAEAAGESQFLVAEKVTDDAVTRRPRSGRAEHGPVRHRDDQEAGAAGCHGQGGERGRAHRRGGRTKSTQPVAMTLAGMPGARAWPGPGPGRARRAS